MLFQILKENEKSEFGNKYNFKNIKSIEDFKHKIPLSEYSDYDKYIERIANGEKNILIKNDIAYFGHTSGTTGKQKLIPVTKKSRKNASKYMAFLINKFAYNNLKDNWNSGKGLMLTDINMTTYTKANIPICSATSGGMKGIKPMLKYLYTSPIEVMEIKDKKTSTYLHLLFALKERNLLYINGIFISDILDLFRTLEKNYDLLVKDIKKGRLNRNLNIDENTRIKLNDYLKPDADRACELEKQSRLGFKGIVKRIWKNLAFIGAVTGGNFTIYNDKVNYYTDNIPIYSAAYAATEAMIGINPYINKIRYAIIPDTVFYEFIPLEDIDKKNFKTLDVNELKQGKAYEIVVTNRVGLYRYRIGDVIKVVGFYNNSPEIQFLYRKNQVLNMVSEKTNEDQLTFAIKNTVTKLNLNLVDYSTVPNNLVTPGRYKFYFELNNPKVNIKDFEKTLDNEIRKSNLAYDRARNKNKLDMVEITLVKNDTFNKIKDFLCKKGTSRNQIKIPRVMNNKNLVDLLNQNKYSI